VKIEEGLITINAAANLRSGEGQFQRGETAVMGLLSKGLRQVAGIMAAVIIFITYAWIYLFLFVFFPIWWPIDRYWPRGGRERTALECVTDFPDDQIEDGRKIVQPGGQAVACAVSDLLKDAGMITTIPALDYEHGWEFDAAQDGRKYWLLVTDLADHKMLIYTENHSPFWRLFGRKAHYVGFLSDLHQLLSEDKRFRSVNWCD
jgi:hypothetical protein